MNLSDLSVERPVLTWMLMLALATFGILGFTRLGVDRYPDMEFPFVGVMISMEGASPTTLEDEVVDQPLQLVPRRRPLPGLGEDVGELFDTTG